MRFLPKANPLYEKIATNKLVITDVLNKLASGGFSGYIQHTAAGFNFYGVFAKGRLLSALSGESGKEKNGFEAIVVLFDKVLQVGGEINVYRMTPDLAVCAHALAAGQSVLDSVEVRQVDMKSLLSRVKSQNVNGVVHFYTAERSAMMFFKDGMPIGFYYDEAGGMVTSPDESKKIAALPGAMVEVCSTKTLDELLPYDLLQMVNLEKMWQSAKSRNSAVSRKEPSPAVKPYVVSLSQEKLLELIDDLSEVATAYLSKEGRAIVEKRIKGLGGPSCLFDEDQRLLFLSQVEADAALCDADARIDEMIDLMKSEIAGRLAV